MSESVSEIYAIPSDFCCLCCTFVFSLIGTNFALGFARKLALFSGANPRPGYPDMSVSERHGRNSLAKLNAVHALAPRRLLSASCPLLSMNLSLHFFFFCRAQRICSWELANGRLICERYRRYAHLIIKLSAFLAYVRHPGAR